MRVLHEKILLAGSGGLGESEQMHESAGSGSSQSSSKTQSRQRWRGGQRLNSVPMQPVLFPEIVPVGEKRCKHLEVTILVFICPHLQRTEEG